MSRGEPTQTPSIRASATPGSGPRAAVPRLVACSSPPASSSPSPRWRAACWAGCGCSSSARSSVRAASWTPTSPPSAYPTRSFSWSSRGALSAALIPVFQSYRARGAGRGGVAPRQQHHQPRPHRAGRPQRAHGHPRPVPCPDRRAGVRRGNHRAHGQADPDHAAEPGPRRHGRRRHRHPQQLPAVHDAGDRAAALQPGDHRARPSSSRRSWASRAWRLAWSSARRRTCWCSCRASRASGASSSCASTWATPASGKVGWLMGPRLLGLAAGQLELPRQHRARVGPRRRQPDRVQLCVPAIADPRRHHRREHRRRACSRRSATTRRSATWAGSGRRCPARSESSCSSRRSSPR